MAFTAAGARRRQSRVVQERRSIVSGSSGAGGSGSGSGSNGSNSSGGGSSGSDGSGETNGAARRASVQGKFKVAALKTQAGSDTSGEPNALGLSIHDMVALATLKKRFHVGEDPLGDAAARAHHASRWGQVGGRGTGFLQGLRGKLGTLGSSSKNKLLPEGSVRFVKGKGIPADATATAPGSSSKVVTQNLIASAPAPKRKLSSHNNDNGVDAGGAALEHDMPERVVLGAAEPARRKLSDVLKQPRRPLSGRCAGGRSGSLSSSSAGNGGAGGNTTALQQQQQQPSLVVTFAQMLRAESHARLAAKVLHLRAVSAASRSPPAAALSIFLTHAHAHSIACAHGTACKPAVGVRFPAGQHGAVRARHCGGAPAQLLLPRLLLQSLPWLGGERQDGGGRLGVAAATAAALFRVRALPAGVFRKWVPATVLSHSPNPSHTRHSVCHAVRAPAPTSRC